MSNERPSNRISIVLNQPKNSKKNSILQAVTNSIKDPESTGEKETYSIT
jgi:hypothetical protein